MRLLVLSDEDEEKEDSLELPLPLPLLLTLPLEDPEEEDPEKELLSLSSDEEDGLRFFPTTFLVGDGFFRGAGCGFLAGLDVFFSSAGRLTGDTTLVGVIAFVSEIFYRFKLLTEPSSSLPPPKACEEVTSECIAVLLASVPSAVFCGDL